MIDAKTVFSSTLSEVQDLIILKILKSLNALKTVIPLNSPPAGKESSIIPIMTIIPSNMLKPSYKYFDNPNPTILKNISNAKMIVKIKFEISWVFMSHCGHRYYSVASIIVFNTIKTIIIF